MPDSNEQSPNDDDVIEAFDEDDFDEDFDDDFEEETDEELEELEAEYDGDFTSPPARRLKDSEDDEAI